MTINIKNTRTGNVAGIVLAGGKSSRMGRNKALLDYNGQPLVEHMMELLKRAGCTDTYVSGAVPGYNGIPDATPYEGPACAMSELLARFDGKYSRLLFVPVDMPLIPVRALKILTDAGNAFFAGYPLPACLATGVTDGSVKNVRELLVQCRAAAISLPPVFESGMKNCNTREDWDALAS